ncbi:hypothetical protein Ana3638_11920 [Anaerocolumna sedimenticola]|uniref:Bacteriophage Gp15 protein n=1 Tax=Anaerocolumna sedimenticola TaxID=2696063 RepID=A0A6P1TML2_9FIRM|nr:Gp15 family bacteriophage protein [Anaerocolumna sedimenticola]QHQ61392.1 hypothetical protein Ana3638_11920 [Anaerocolumna sedimenticola]
MIGRLPDSLEVNGIQRNIRSDFRTALLIFQAYNDPEMTDWDKTIVMLDCLYEDFDSFTQDDIQEAIEKGVYFLDGGKDFEEIKASRKVIDWEQDEQIIFPALNKVAGYEIRSKKYVHWWTVIGFFYEIGEGLFSNVLTIRQKLYSGKKLEKYEQEFYRNNKQLIDLKTRYTAEEQAEIDRLNKLLG